MPTFRCGTGAAIVNPLIADNARTNSRTDSSVEDVAVAAPRTPVSFSQRCRVGIVLDLHGHAIGFLDLGRERKVAPAADIGRIDDNARIWIQGPGRANANST